MPQKLEQMSETASKWCAEQEAEAAAKQLRKTEAAAEADREAEADKEAEAAASAPKEKDMFCLIAEAAEADAVESREAAFARIDPRTDSDSESEEQGTAAARLRQAAASKEKDVFCLIAEAAEADDVARAEATEDAARDAAVTVEHILGSCRTCRSRFDVDGCILTLYSDMCTGTRTGTQIHKNVQCGECVHHCNKWNFGTKKERAAICRAVKGTQWYHEAQHDE
jgi:hypothetical protein